MNILFCKVVHKQAILSTSYNNYKWHSFRQKSKLKGSKTYLSYIKLVKVSLSLYEN